MAMFLTKVWGFSEPCGPLQFGTAGWRERASSLLQDGDRVILVGTQNDETTDKTDQGRILGMMEPTKEMVRCLDYPLERSSSHTNAEGRYKWPFGLVNRRAWVFDSKPFLTAVTHRRFNIDAAAGIVALSPAEENSVLTHPHREIGLLTPLRTRIEEIEAFRRHNAPVPTTTRRGIMHMRREPANTYVMRIEGASSPSFKIGWAFNSTRRQREFNLYALPTLGGLAYKPFLSQKWDTAKNAFLMEQAILKRFTSQRHSHNSEVICNVSDQQIQSVWAEVFLARSSHK